MSRLRDFATRVPAGLLDTGFSSAATFLVQIAVVRTLSGVELGVWALAFSAFILAGEIPTHAFFVPCELRSFEHQRHRRIRSLLTNVRAGLPLVLASSPLVLIGLLPSWSHVDTTELIELSILMISVTFLSPVQDHVRRMCHIADESWLAAGIAVAQFVVVIGAIVGGVFTGGVAAGFQALVMANVVSLVVAGLVLRSRAWGLDLGLSISGAFVAGKFLLGASLSSTSSRFLLMALVHFIAGPTVLGYVEGARVLARPVQVMGAGFTAIMGPRSIEAARSRSSEAAGRMRRYFAVAVSCAGLGYIAVLLVPVVHRQLVELLPSAFGIPGLVFALGFAHIVRELDGTYRAELMGVDRAPVVAAAALLAGVAGLAIAPLAISIDPLLFAGVVLIDSVVLLVALRSFANLIYDARSTGGVRADMMLIGNSWQDQRRRRLG